MKDGGQVTGHELAPEVDPDGLGRADLVADTLENLDHVRGSEAQSRHECWRTARVGVHDRQDPDLHAGRELVMDRACAAPPVRARWRGSIAQVSLARTGGQRSSRSFAFTRRLGTLFRS